MATGATPWSVVRRKAEKWFRAAKPRRLKRAVTGLLVVVSLSGGTCYWLMFVRVTNGGLAFENPLLILEFPTCTTATSWNTKTTG